MKEKDIREYREKCKADILAITGYDNWKDIPQSDYRKFFGNVVGNYRIERGIVGKRGTITNFMATSLGTGKAGNYPVGRLLSGRLTGVGSGGGNHKHIAKHEGEKFGKLTLIKYQSWWEDGATRSGFKCQCDCGMIIDHVLWESLEDGSVTSCGNCNEEVREIHVGDRFGKLTAVTPIYNGDELEGWYCKCDCGNGITVTVEELLDGRVIDCENCITEADIHDKHCDLVRDDFLDFLKDESKTYLPITICIDEKLYNEVRERAGFIATTPRKFVVAAIKMALAGFNPKYYAEPIQKELLF